MTRIYLVIGLLLALSASIALHRSNASVENINHSLRLLDDIEAVDRETYYHLILLHAGVVKNFDSLVVLEREHQRLVEKLMDGLDDIDADALLQHSQRIEDIAREKSSQLERFKSDTAILNNAKIYIGEKISSVSTQLSTSATLLKLSTALVVFAESPSQALAQEVRDLAEQLESQGMPPKALGELNKGKRHLDYYLDKKLSVFSGQSLTRNWSQFPLFEELKNELIARTQSKRLEFQLAFLALAMGVVIIAAFALSSLNRYVRARQELVILNNSLEEKIKVAVSEIKESRDEAVRANAAKTSFLANLSHEVRTPLNSIIGFSARLEKKMGASDESNLRSIKSIHANGIQLMNFFKDLLELSRFIIDKPQNAIGLEQSIDLLAVCKERAADLQPLMEKKSLRFEVDSHENCHLHCGASQAQGVINGALSTMIILTNSGTIKCKISGNDTGCEIVFYGQGETLDERRIARILDPFSPEDDLSTKVENIGLGLSLTKKILDSLGGNLQLKSSNGENKIVLKLVSSHQDKSASAAYAAKKLA